MKILHCDIWDNNVTAFCDDIDCDNDEGVIFAFADHDDIESWEPVEDESGLTVFH
jgi:hypothetical protein